ncbi:hypothetical protein EZS27_015236 [termite gut metagenome]|uniref:Uncharacterized protein n=1 Tax=termite gut metagenome TaxID=433724 RepID=A0A5J4RRS0_9ZZZZ
MVATWEQPPSGSERSKKGFGQEKMEFFADKNTSCYCLMTIKSAIVGGRYRYAERLPVDFGIST